MLREGKNKLKVTRWFSHRTPPYVEVPRAPFSSEKSLRIVCLD
jgi:hypothetical protein